MYTGPELVWTTPHIGPLYCVNWRVDTIMATGLCSLPSVCVVCPSLLQIRSKVMRLQALKYSSDQLKLLPDAYHQVCVPVEV